MKWEIAKRINVLNKLVGAEEEIIAHYPAWKYAPVSPLRDVMVETFEELFDKKPEVFVMHAGLECGFFSEKKPGIDIVSCGPNMRGIHSFNEKLYIDSVERTWNFFLATLAKLK